MDTRFKLPLHEADLRIRRRSPELERGEQACLLGGDGRHPADRGAVVDRNGVALDPAQLRRKHPAKSS